jgi:hypothetical protein
MSTCDGKDGRVVAYADRMSGFVFVKVPGEYGRYVRTSRIVTVAGCPACGSNINVPCKGQYDRYTGSIHADRMRAANSERLAHGHKDFTFMQSGDVLEEQVTATPENCFTLGPEQQAQNLKLTTDVVLALDRFIHRVNPRDRDLGIDFDVLQKAIHLWATLNTGLERSKGAQSKKRKTRK